MEKITPERKQAHDRNIHKEFKPDVHILNIIDALKPLSLPVTWQDNTPLKLIEADQHQCFLLHRGHVDLCRQDGQLVLNTESAPFIFGLSSLSLADNRLILLPSRDAVVSVISLHKSLEIIAKKALWSSVAHLLIYISNRIYEHFTRMSQCSSYETVRTLLHELLEEPETVREATPVLHYIRSRCFLSRSGILKIMSELRTGGYIDLNEGKLVKIHSLPKKF